ncbi:hypothetical protein AGLY_014204 [Aphis glycines]|uniref:FLYWCH-type domain-containing protein n=1 Tax=Aphis glycines TaxID=307491 RepID=A0A6G0T4F0_APHGL|nr:hypothetical protein AGLY_014204 [Aphis glycines]
MEFITSTRGKKMIVENGHKYILAYTSSKNVERWRCSIKICLEKILIQDGTIFKKHDSHNHEQCTTIARQNVTTACKRVAVEDISIRPRKIILTEMNNHITNTDFTVSDVSAIRKSIYYARKKTLPSNPKSVSDVHKVLNDLQLTTSKNEDFLFINDELSNIIIFTCHENLTFLYEVSDCFIDDCMSEIPDDPKYREYADYLVDNYIGENANFPPIIWVAFAADLTRTINNEILIKTVQTDVYIKINSCIKNIPNSRKNAQVKARLKKTLKAIDNYTNEKLTRYDYVQIVAFNYNKD